MWTEYNTLIRRETKHRISMMPFHFSDHNMSTCRYVMLITLVKSSYIFVPPNWCASHRHWGMLWDRWSHRVQWEWSPGRPWASSMRQALSAMTSGWCAHSLRSRRHRSSPTVHHTALIIREQTALTVRSRHALVANISSVSVTGKGERKPYLYCCTAHYYLFIYLFIYLEVKQELWAAHLRHGMP